MRLWVLLLVIAIAPSSSAQSRIRHIDSFQSGRSIVEVYAMSDGFISLQGRSLANEVVLNSRCDWVEKYSKTVRDSLNVPVPKNIADGELVTFQGPQLDVALSDDRFNVSRVFTRLGSSYYLNISDKPRYNSVSVRLSPTEFTRFTAALIRSAKAVREMNGITAGEGCFR